MKFITNKKISKGGSLLLSVFLIAQSFSPIFTYASESSESATPEITETTEEASPSGEANINTGDTEAGSNTENVVNTNLTGTGSFESITITGEHEGDIVIESNGPQTEFSGEVSNELSGDVKNDVAVDAISGENAASGNNGDVSITTGNAAASANIFNLVNFNVTGSGWQVFMVNIFGELIGNIVIDPAFYEQVQNGTGSYRLVIVENESTAYVVNNISVTANSGGNVASGNNGDVKIETGEAQSVSKVLDMINTNIYGENFFFLIVNNLGQWVGKVVELDCTTSDCPADPSTVYSYGRIGECNGDCPSYLFVNNNSEANVENNVFVSANTGDNSANGNNGNVLIKTGNAYASVRIIDIINSNITGRNFFFGMINNFGSWFGNLVFGACGGPDDGDDEEEEEEIIIPSEGPELVIVKENTSEGALAGGNTLTFKISVKNYGKAMARNVTLFDKLYDPNKTELTNQSWYLGEILPGEEVIVEYTIFLSKEAPLGLYENKAHANGKDLGDRDVESGEASSVFTVIGGGVVIATGGPEQLSASSDVLGAKVTPATGSNEWELMLASILLLVAGALLKKSLFFYGYRQSKFRFAFA